MDDKRETLAETIIGVFDNLNYHFCNLMFIFTKKRTGIYLWRQVYNKKETHSNVNLIPLLIKSRR